MKATVAAMENCVELPSSLGAAMPGVNEKPATGPVPPLLPQAPQVNQFGESSILLSTVALPDDVGVGEGEAPGTGVGVGEAPATGVPDALEAVLPPQPIMMKKTATIRASENRLRQLRTVTPRGFGLKWKRLPGTVLSRR